MESSIIIPGLKEAAIKACDDFFWHTTRTLLLHSLKEDSLEYQQLTSIPKDNKNIIVDCCLYGYIELISVFINNNFPVNHGIRRRVSGCFNDYFSVIAPYTRFPDYVTFDCMLHYAIIGRQLPLIRYLVSHGADVNIVSGLGDTPLHCIFRTQMTIEICETPNTGYSRCTQYSNKEILKFLLEAGCNVNGKNSSGNVSLHYAIFEGDIECVEMLINFGADVNIVSGLGDTPLHCIFRTQTIEIYETPNTGYSSSTQYSNKEILKFLLEAGCNVNGKNSRGNVPLHYAIFEGDIECVEMLINFGADPNIKHNNDTALSYAVSAEHPVFQIIELLLNAGAHPYASVLYDALLRQDLNIIELLLERGADINDKIPGNVTPFYAFVFWDNPISDTIEDGFVTENVINIVGTLLIWGANVTISDDCGLTLLHWAAWQGSVHLVKLLIDKGLDVKDMFGKRPIHYASDAGHHNIVQYFIDYYCHKFM